jgi:heterodisulfide reductase subunit C
MPIHEKSLIRPENLIRKEKVTIEGIDVSGDWSTFIAPRVITDYNDSLQDEIAALPGGEYIHRCWQCGSCTNSCTVNAINPDFNPRYWIYLIRLGMEAELLRDRDIIWQCVSCNKCTYACPRDVVPEGVMKATAHWLELKGYVKPSPSSVFDREFSSQVFAHGRIEEGRLLRRFFARTGQKLTQEWLIGLVRRLVMRLPVAMLARLGLAVLLHPHSRNWSATRRAIADFIAEQEAHQRAALHLPPATEPRS